MATSAFKSTSRRTGVGASSGTDDSGSSNGGAHRRSRSLSRFSRRLLVPECSDEAPAPPQGRFVNTVRGSGFPEISLDDLAIELLSDEMESERGRVSRLSSNFSPSTPSEASRRRGRSVSRQNPRVVDEKGNASIYSARGRSVGNKSASDQSSRRRRSVSLARYQIADSEHDINHSQKYHNLRNQKCLISGNAEMMLVGKPTSLNHRRGLGRSSSQKDLSKLQEGYSSPSSALTDDEAKVVHDNGIERTIRAVYAQKKTEHPIGDDVNSGLYEAMRIELRHAVEEIKKELEQAKVRPKNSAITSNDCVQSNSLDSLQSISAFRRNYATKLERSEKRKHDLLAEILLEEERGKEVSKIVRELLPDPKNTTIVQKPVRTRKRSNDRNRMSKRLTEEAEKYLEDFISNVEDTDFSSFDGERSDTSSTLERNAKSKDTSTHCGNSKTQSSAISKSDSFEMDGIVLPWLQWETSNDGSPISCQNRTQSPTIPSTFLPDTAQEGSTTADRSNHSVSSHGSTSPGVTNWTDSINVRGSKFAVDESYQSESCSLVGTKRLGYFDIQEYLSLQNSEDLLFENLKQQQRISSGSLLLCSKLYI